MATPTPTPAPEQAARGREDTTSRSFEYFEPAGRRATVYEDVTVDTQPSVHRHLTRGWPLHFEDGRGTWSENSTRLRVADWFAFRDPGQKWERIYFQDGAGFERQIEQSISTAKRDGTFADFRPEWVSFLRAQLQVPAWAEHGLWLALAVNARDCLSDTLCHANALWAGMKQRQAQALLLYGMDLEGELGDFEVEPAKETFLSAPAWQGTRRYLERLRTPTDWGETIVAAGAVYEPIIGTLLRRELFMRPAAQLGDAVTPAVLRPAQEESAWAMGWVGEFVRLVCEDPEHGAANAEVVRGWLEEWNAEASAAVDALAEVFEQVPGGAASFAQARAAAEGEQQAMLAGIPGLSDAVTA
jgi:propane monooxygenase small subunit